jgi:hypothetical protein
MASAVTNNAADNVKVCVRVKPLGAADASAWYIPHDDPSKLNQTDAKAKTVSTYGFGKCIVMCSLPLRTRTLLTYRALPLTPRRLQITSSTSAPALATFSTPPQRAWSAQWLMATTALCLPTVRQLRARPTPCRVSYIACKCAEMAPD